MKSILVIGLGRFGGSLTMLLAFSFTKKQAPSTSPLEKIQIG